MKCLSLKQPFANLLAFGEKTVELRKWNTKFRGEFLIHASKKIDEDACERLDIILDNLSIGAIIGSAFLYDVKVYSNQEDFNRDKQNHFYMMSKFIVIKKILTEINKTIFLLFPNILMVTNMDF